MQMSLRQLARAFSAQSGSIEVPLHRLQQAISPQVCTHLQQKGYAVVDGVLGSAVASALRSEVDALRPYMHNNCTHLVTSSGSTQLLPKKDIKEADLLAADIQALATLSSVLQNDTTLRTMLGISLPHLTLDTQAIKLQWNSGDGGCFPMHFDTDASVDTRRVTAIWYLNPEWQPSHGGELRLYPFLQGDPVIDIAPLNDRIVLFSSQKMLHRVLPSSKERCCATIWLSEGPRRAPREDQRAAEERAAARAALASPTPLDDAEAFRVLSLEEIRKHAAKWYYREEWAKSIEQSHPEGPQRDALLKGFWREVAVVERALAPTLPALQRVAQGGQLPLVDIQWL